MEDYPKTLGDEITKLFLKNMDKLGEYTAEAKLASTEVAAFGVPRKYLHKGAIRAYEEMGIKIQD